MCVYLCASGNQLPEVHTHLKEHLLLVQKSNEMGLLHHYWIYKLLENLHEVKWRVPSLAIRYRKKGSFAN